MSWDLILTLAIGVGLSIIITIFITAKDDEWEDEE